MTDKLYSRDPSFGVVVSEDVMTARFARLPWPLVEGVTRELMALPGIAAAAVDGSGMTFHSTRGMYAILPPDAHSGASLRGM